MCKIYIKKDLLGMERITSEGVMVLVALCKITGNMNRVTYTNKDIIEFVLKGEIGNRTIQTKIKNGLSNLQDIEIIDYEEQGKILIINTEKLYRQKNEYFVSINDSELQKIMNLCKKKLSNDILLRYFLIVVATINNTSKCGFTNQEALSYRAEVTTDRVIDLNKILEELKLLYIHRTDKVQKDKFGGISKISNTYGRFSDKEAIKKEAIAFTGIADSFAASINMQGDERRSIKQKYNIIIKKLNNREEISIDKIKEINELVEDYNKATKLSGTDPLDLIPVPAECEETVCINNSDDCNYDENEICRNGFSDDITFIDERWEIEF